jgi:hypothetical protein
VEAAVRLVPARVEPVVDRHRGPLEAIFVASDAVIVPVTLRTGERLEMAVLPADLDRALAQLRQLTGGWMANPRSGLLPKGYMQHFR